MQTFEGIDRCGERLAHEVEECIAKHPSLERISVMGHSMGGLIVRYAVGVHPPACNMSLHSYMVLDPTSGLLDP